MERRTLTYAIVAMIIVAIIAGAVGYYMLPRPAPPTPPVGPIKIGIVDPLSGGAAYEGQSGVNGAMLAVEEINAKGGVLGRKLLLIPEDSTSDPASAAAAVRKLIVEDKVVCVLGDYFSSNTAAMLEVSDEYEVPLITGISTAPKLTEEYHKWFFRTVATDAMNALAYAKFMIEQGPKTFVIIAVDLEFGREAAGIYGPSLEALGGEILADVYWYGAEEVDFSAMITDILAKKPDAIVEISETVAGALFVKQAEDAGIDVPIFGIGAQATPAYIETAGEAAVGVYSCLGYCPLLDTPGNAEFIEKYVLRYHEDPTEYAGFEYSDVYLVAAAIEHAGSADPAAIRDALEKIEISTIIGPIKFDEMHQSYSLVVIVQIKEGGEITLFKAVKAEKPPS